MRNISIIQDQILSLELGSAPVVSISVNHNQHRLYALTETGILASYDISDGFKLLAKTRLFFEEIQETWFALDFLMIGSTVVALSREGSIVTAEDEGDNLSGELTNVDQIGVIDGGIRAASWSPDFSSLAIVTGNNTLLLMSNTWEPISEIDLPPVQSSSSLEVSWKGDGELLSIVSQDEKDQIYYARIYDKLLQLHATGRNVADGPASVLKGVGGAVSFAPNGSLVAIYQRKAAELPQVAFLEKNGLRHGDFDLRKPPTPAGMILGDWDVTHLAWDMTSTVIAVSWSAMILSQTESSSTSSRWGCVQLYYRENYHWYLKQQWTGSDLHFLMFDNEVPGRLYFSQRTSTIASLRIVDTFWKMSSSHCRDGTVTVTDGEIQHFTPLGYNNVPPPMSMYQEKWTNTVTASIPEANQLCARSVSFWRIHPDVVQNSSFLWGAAFLLNEEGLVSFVLGNEKGRIAHAGFLHLPNHQQCSLREICVLDLQAKAANKLVLVAVGSMAHTVSDAADDRGHGDVMMAVHLDATTLFESTTASSTNKASTKIPFTHHYTITHFPGSIFAMTSIVGEEYALAVGIKHHDTGNFDVFRLDFATAFVDLAASGETLPEFASLDFNDFPMEHLMIIPEVCPHLYVLLNTSSTIASYYSHTVISLSLRNRLYVGEVLLVPGASSFVFNHAYNMLMFITVGTKPMLHFVTWGTLLKINPLMGEDQQDLFEAAEPRPVERGARLITSIENDSKIVIQLPRGNLETFEPRPLIILRAQHLLNQRQLADCLVLLRLQRIDLNYLIDFDPTIFFDELARFVPEAIVKKADLLSLLITSLDSVDVTTTKYLLFDESSLENRTRRRQFVEETQFFGDNKVNVTCTKLREELLSFLQRHQSTQNASPQVSSTITNAILCTFAKQRPPLLVDALHFIQQQTTSQQQNNSKAAAQQQIASIKYLAFLVDGSQLFDAAMGDCVFDLARAVARQCQMDPKVYLPLLEKFESIGRGHAPESLHHVLMHLHVQHHLSRAWATIEDLLQLLTKLYQAEESSSESTETVSLLLLTSEQVETAVQLAEEMMLSSTVSGGDSNDLMAKLLPQLVTLETLMEEELATTDSLSSSSSTAVRVSVSHARHFISATRRQYAQHCYQQMQFTRAISAFLACYPPLPQRAIDAAMAAGDWQQAIFLANRFHSNNNSNNNSFPTVIAPMKLIQDIVNNFKQNQDSVSMAVVLEVTAATLTQELNTAASGESSGTTPVVEDNKAVSAAKLCVDYLQDVESAVTILVTAQQWTLAMDYAGRFQRRDLYDEIYLAAREAAEDLIATLDEKKAQFPKAASILRELWTTTTTATNDNNDGEEKVETLDRLHQVARHDRLLQRILERLEQGDDYEDAVNNSNNNAGGDTQSVLQDNASDFSAASKYSLLSLRSARSSQSGVSVQSTQSRASSQYSLASSTAAASSTSSNSNNQNFSIQGLEHTLLSRGTVDPNGPPPNTGANKPFHEKNKKPMSKGEKRRKKAAEEVEELRKERERALLDGESNLNQGHNTNGQSDETETDYSRRKSRRHERQRYRAQEKNKDDAGLKPEADHCEGLWQATVTVSQVTQLVTELCHVLQVNQGVNVHDHVLAIRVQTTAERYLQALQEAVSSLPPAPEYPLPWLKQRNMLTLQFFQDVRLLYQHIVQLRCQNQACVSSSSSEVRVEDMAILRRYEHDIWHVLRRGMAQWQKAKLLLLQESTSSK